MRAPFCAGVFAIIVMWGCGQQRATVQPAAAATAVVEHAQPATDPAGPAFRVLSHAFSIERVGDACVLKHRHEQSEAEERLDLGLLWPCYVVPWRSPPPPIGDADGSPIGAAADARAYRFRNGVTAVVVLGDPLAESDTARAGANHCARTMRALLIDGPKLWLSARRATGGASLSCIEGGGPDAKEYWLFAH